MKKHLPTLLATLVWSTFYSHTATASLAQQCALGVPQYKQPLVQGDPNDLPVEIQSTGVAGHYPNDMSFSGPVHIKQGNSQLDAQQVQIQQHNQPHGTEQTATATGNVHYSDPQIQVTGPKAWSNFASKDTDIEQPNYQMVGRQGRGTADKAELRDNQRYTILKNGSFTSCLPGDNSWSVLGSTIIQDKQQQEAKIWNARFTIAGVPVFYSPYLSLPIGDKRRSGFLVPNAKYSSSNGFEFLLPYYWNIAPNYDATITPHYISKRGLQWQTEFRYLNALGSGTMALDWLPNDQLYPKDYPDGTHKNRWLYYWANHGVFDQFWRFDVDFTKVSDPHYFADLDSAYGSTTDGYASQKLSVGYANSNWDVNLASKQFQVFAGSGNTNAYRAQPQLDVNYYYNDLGPFDFHFYGQTAYFTSEDPSNPKAVRWHAEPTLNLPLANRWGSLDSQVKLLATHYQQSNVQRYNQANPASGLSLDSSVNRLMPQFKSDAKMVFERDMSFAQGYTQTLEPRLQYLYIPYRDQSHIYSYDSTLLQADYNGLFRDRSYSGLDRIASANQLSSGITTRLYDEDLTERFNTSIGQIYYFDRPRTGDPYSALDTNKQSGSLVWASDSYWKINRNWGLRGGLQYDNRLSSVSVGDAVLEYRPDEQKTIQLNYRYANANYIQAMLPNVTYYGYQQGISQTGILASWPIAGNIALVGAYYYDSKANQSADQWLGLQYNTCCWAINLGYERKINGWNDNTNSSNYDNKISFNIELRGLSSDHSLGNQDMLRSGILPYQRAF